MNAVIMFVCCVIHVLNENKHCCLESVCLNKHKVTYFIPSDKDHQLNCRD